MALGRNLRPLLGRRRGRGAWGGPGPHLSWTSPSAFPISAPGKGRGCLQPPNGHCHSPGPRAHRPERCAYVLGSHMGICTQSCRWCFLTGRGSPRSLAARATLPDSSDLGCLLPTTQEWERTLVLTCRVSGPCPLPASHTGLLVTPGLCLAHSCLRASALAAPSAWRAVLQTSTQPHLPRASALRHLASEAFPGPVLYPADPCPNLALPAPPPSLLLFKGTLSSPQTGKCTYLLCLLFSACVFLVPGMFAP